MEQLAAISCVRQIHPEEELFHEGDRTDFMYVILSGEILVENYIPSVGERGVTRAEPLDVIGWSCLTPMVRQRVAAARACQPTRVLAIEGELLAQLCDSDHDLGYLIMRRVANIVAINSWQLACICLRSSEIPHKPPPTFVRPILISLEPGCHGSLAQPNNFYQFSIYNSSSCMNLR